MLSSVCPNQNTPSNRLSEFIDVEETDDGERMLTLLDSRVSTVVCAVDVVDALQELDLNAGIQNQPSIYILRVTYGSILI
jgi:hypothetical protein